jgi:hypothetical protein
MFAAWHSKQIILILISIQLLSSPYLS